MTTRMDGPEWSSVLAGGVLRTRARASVRDVLKEAIAGLGADHRILAYSRLNRESSHRNTVEHPRHRALDVWYWR